ncbi:hypothetical protein WNY37_08735 [Henriciella sp. AS95]|uniref:hypothetical protein n=1 Tax=Henriciella sp. AS95 TaxID=3135782 RepID=UPI00316BD0EC
MAHIKRSWAIAAVSLVAACSTGNSSDPASICTGLLAGDPEVESDLADLGASVETYCECYATNIDTLGEEAQTTVLKVSQVIADIRSERNVGVEGAAGIIEDDAEDANASTYDITKPEFEITGQFVDGVRLVMRDNDGQCAQVDMR